MKKVILGLGKDALEAMKLDVKERKIARREFIKKLEKNDKEAWRILKESSKKNK